MGTYLQRVTVGEASEAIETQLHELARRAEFRAAHHREFIPDGVAAPVPVQAALNAAVEGGFVMGLTSALKIVRAVLREIDS